MLRFYRLKPLFECPTKIRSIRHITTSPLNTLSRTPFPAPSRKPLLPQNELIDEENIPGYESTKFYPANPGEVIANRYQLLFKVGWGAYSTVWFARDMRGNSEDPEIVLALKIINTDGNQEAVNEERDNEAHIAKRDPSHSGRFFLRTHTDAFDITGPKGRHMCLAYPPMKEPFSIFQRRFENRAIPIPYIKLYLMMLLKSLDYLHTSCKIAHTDLKLNNIMVSFDSEEVLGDYINSQLDKPVHYKTDYAGRSIYEQHDDFGVVRDIQRTYPQIVDFGSSSIFENFEGEYGVYPIQAPPYRAPEVILGRGWNMSTDIWNFGVLLWPMIQGKELFRQAEDAQGRYQPKEHLAEMIALLGHPPPELITRAASMSGYQWPQSVQNADGVLCDNAEEFFGGPFFDENGKFLYEDLIPDRKLVDTIPLIDEEERDNFLSFAKMMLAWLPEERKTARELLDHPFIQLEQKATGPKDNKG